MAEPPQASRDFYGALQRFQLALVGIGRRLWRQVLPGDLDGSWQRVAPQMVAYTAGAQLAAARTAADYVPAVLAETGQRDDPDARVRPEAFAGTAYDGRPLDTLLEGGIRTAKAKIGAGADPTEALIGGRQWLETALRTVVTDAARDATAVQIAARGGVGWVRQVNPPCCSRCAVLAGKWFAWNDGFLRHPRCFPAGVVVSGPGHEAATRRRYQGELVTLTTASGQQLPLTGNHPVLTGSGWVPANLLREGDEVIRSTRPEGAQALVSPDHHEVPARIEDVWGSFQVNGLGRVPSTAEDFHGDGRHGYVEVVRAHRPLQSDALLSPLVQQVAQDQFAGGLDLHPPLAVERVAAPVDLGEPQLPGGLVGGGGLGLPFGFGHGGGADVARFAQAAARYPGLQQALGDGAAGHAVLAGQGEFARPGLVGANDVAHRQVVTPRWDAPGDAFTVETAEGYARLGRDLLHRLAGQVELDRVVELRRVEWSGHVYSLTSAEGWHTANSLIVSNCDCVHIPARENMAGSLVTDPHELWRRGLITDLSLAQEKRLEQDADLVKVLNESRDRWRVRMALQRKAEKEAAKRRGAWGTNEPTPLPPGGIQDFLSHLTSRVEALRELEARGITE